MVLFYEDDEKLKAPPTKLRRWIGRLFRTVMIAGFILVVSLIALSSLGGTNEPLKLGLQDYLRKVTGLEPEIETLNKVTFYPDLSIDLNNLSFKMPDQDIPLAKIQSVKLVIDFWDIFFSRGRIKSAALSNIHITEGAHTKHALDIDSLTLAIDAEKKTEGKLLAQGRYGGGEFFADISMAVDVSVNGEAFFSRAKASQIHINAPFLKLSGTLNILESNATKFHFDTISTPGGTLSGTAHLQRDPDTKQGILSATLHSENAGERVDFTKELEKLYCFLAPANKPLFKSIAVGEINIDGLKVIPVATCAPEKEQEPEKKKEQKPAPKILKSKFKSKP